MWRGHAERGGGTAPIAALINDSLIRKGRLPKVTSLCQEGVLQCHRRDQHSHAYSRRPMHVRTRS